MFGSPLQVPLAAVAFLNVRVVGCRARIYAVRWSRTCLGRHVGGWACRGCSRFGDASWREANAARAKTGGADKARRFARGASGLRGELGVNGASTRVRCAGRRPVFDGGVSTRLRERIQHVGATIRRT